jgi:hypothetical protein
MKNYLRFYIVIHDASALTWSEVRYFIEDVEKTRSGCNAKKGGFDFHHLDIFSNVEEKEDMSRFRKQRGKEFGKKVRNEFFLKEEGKDNLKNYRIVDFVIVLKLTDSFIDFKRLIPFFLIHEKFPNTSFGIDFNGIPDKESRNNLLFSIGQFLWNWKTDKSLYADHLVFSILDDEFKDKKSGKLVKIETATLPTKKDVVLRRYSPLIEINKSVFDKLFVNTLFKTLPKPSMNGGSENLLAHLKPEDFKIEKINVDIEKLFVRRYIDFKEKVNLAPVVEDLLFENFKNEPFIAFYIFCMVLDQLMLENAGIKTRGKRWAKALTKLYNENKLLNYIILIRRYVTGLREVAENIIFHTDSQKGYFYFVLKSSNQYSLKIEAEQSELKRNKQYKDLYIKLLKERIEYLPKRFLEVVLMDLSEVGIIQKYKSSFYADKKVTELEEEEKANLARLQLEDFYVGKFSRFPGVSHLDMRYLAQLGLKTFAAIIKSKRGYFEVETNQEKGKRRLVYFRNIKGIDEHQKKWFSDNIDRTIGDGTHYDILLPVSEVLIQDEEEVKTTFEVKSFIELFEKWLHSKKEPEIIDFKDFEDFSVGAYDKKEDFVKKIGEKIVQHYRKEKKNSVLSVDFESVQKNSIDFSTFIKILSYVQLANQINCIIIYNLNKNSFNQMMNQLRILADFGKFWNNHSWIYLYDENGVPYIITGEDAAACDHLNKIVELHYGYCYSILEDFSGESQTDPIKHNILPYELLIQTTNKGKIPVTLFEKNVFCILEKEIENRDFGVMIKDAHMRLGSKIHLDNFYQAEVLFHDNFYVERFAYLVARDILTSRRNKNKIFLIGYGSYSEMFLNRTKHILNYEAQSKADSQGLDICPAYFICNDVEELKWQGIERLKDINIWEEYDFALIVSVASSLTTNYKIIKSFENQVGNIAKNDDFFRVEKLIFNASIILIRDKNENQPTDKEQFYKWDNIHFQNKTVKTDNFKKPIKFYVCEQGGWNRPINCSRCFPDLYSDKKLTDEKLLLETSKASINPKLVLGWPKVEVEGINYANEKKRIRRFMDCIKYGHIERNANHHLYYIDTLKFFEAPDNKNDIRNWLEEIKPAILEDDGAYNIIVSVLHYSNTGFINLVNDTIFNGAATIIIFDLDHEFRDNVITKYSYLKDLKGNIKFHFVDDAILTGRNFIMARSFVTSIFEEFGSFKGTKTDIEIFSSIIVLLNRLSAYRKKDFLQLRKKFDNEESNKAKKYTIFKSYVTLFVPPIRDPESFCFICRYQEIYKRLSEYSVLDRLKFYFNEKANNLELKEEFKEEDFAEPRIYFRLRLTHLIYYLLSNADDHHEKVIEKIWNHKEHIRYKIDAIKVFSSPLLCYYKNIENIVFPKMVVELDQLIDKTKDEIEILDFNLLINLMKQLTQLKSNFILRKKNIERIWRFYANYKSKYDLLYTDLYESPKSREYLQLIAQLLKEEKKLEEMEKSTAVSHREDPLVIKNKINELIERIKGISGKEILPVKQCLNALLKSLEITDPHLSAKTVCNLAEFKFVYVTMVKLLVYTDEAKSLWFEHLLRTGNEFPNIKNFCNFQSIGANIPYNELYKKFDDDDSVSEKINRDFKDFFVMVKLENVTILQRVLNKFTEEIYHERLKMKIRENQFRINDLDTKNEFKDFLDKIKREYYYEYLRPIISGKDSDTYKKVFDVYLLKTYIELLIGADIKEDFTIEDAIGQITQKVVEIMEAEKGFFTIKKFRTKEKKLYTMGRCKTAANEVPFELTKDYLTYQEINNEKSWYTFFSPRRAEWKGKEKEIANVIIIIRFFHSKSLITKDFNSIGGFTFLYEDEYEEGEIGQIEENVKRAQHKENIRYIMLIKDVLKPFLEKNFDNDNFNNWIEAKKRDEFYTARFAKFYHGAEKDIENLGKAIKMKNFEHAMAYCLIVDTDTFIGNLYGQYISGKLNISSRDTIYVDNFNVFTNEFRSNLKTIENIYDFTIVYRLNKSVKTTILEMDLQKFIFEIISNFIKKGGKGSKGNVTIGFNEQDNLFIETTGSDLDPEITEEKLNESIRAKHPLIKGIGLFTINKCINNYFGEERDVEIQINRDDGKFKVIIPLR